MAGGQAAARDCDACEGSDTGQVVLQPLGVHARDRDLAWGDASFDAARVLEVPVGDGQQQREVDRGVQVDQSDSPPEVNHVREVLTQDDEPLAGPCETVGPGFANDGCGPIRRIDVHVRGDGLPGSPSGDTGLVGELDAAAPGPVLPYDRLRVDRCVVGEQVGCRGTPKREGVRERGLVVG